MNIDRISTIISVIGGVVGVVGGISALSSSRDARLDACETRKDALVLTVTTNQLQEKALSLKAQLHLRDIEQSTTMSAGYTPTKSEADVIEGLRKIATISDLYGKERKTTPELIDSIPCTDDNMARLAKMRRNEQATQESLQPHMYEEIFRRSEQLLKRKEGP